ncbi:hypothetical protein NQ176_g5613 [Zarea fungicola]|uniref:Uncharacterized protein n=1 Tax=Zarea fungicola TaxID=93591 RepID=A0ACC1N7J7_9HYPO|nr:hypothetical protein NQ176_g5613 [Lecanicillium fungicola]
MATTTAQPEPPQRPQSQVLDNVAIAFAVGTPLVMLLPPRKMDLRFFVLAATFSLSTNHLCKSWTGQSIYGRFTSRVNSTFDTSLPEGARRTQQLLKEHREREAAEKGLLSSTQGKDRTLIKDIWLGGEDDDWKQKRAEEHRKSFEEGKGLSDIIFEQIGDVFSGNWRKTKKGQEPEPTKVNDLEAPKK